MATLLHSILRSTDTASSYHVDNLDGQLELGTTSASTMSALLRLVQQHTPCLRVVLAAAGGDVASRLGNANLVIFGERHGEPEILAAQLKVSCSFPVRCLLDALPLPLHV